jgi:hypothetical protein
MATPSHANVDGKVWTKNNAQDALIRIDLASGRIESLGKANIFSLSDWSKYPPAEPGAYMKLRKSIFSLAAIATGQMRSHCFDGSVGCAREESLVARRCGMKGQFSEVSKGVM